MRRIGISVVSSGLLLVMTTALNAPASGEGTGPAPVGTGGTTLLVPAYFYPAGDRLADWARLAEAARSIPLEVIVNPASGPGKRQDPRYVAVVNALRRSGGRVLAYVNSNYGRRPLAAVEADLRTYRSFYAVNGFFIDQMANTPEALEHYRSIRRLIRQFDPMLKVVGNPGTSTRPEYLDAADTLVIFEGSVQTFAANDPQKAAPWIVGQPPDRFAMIIYDVPTASAGRDALSRAKWAGAGSAYITDQKMPNPYRGLPPYWADEIATFRAMNQLGNPVLPTPQTPPSLPGE